MNQHQALIANPDELYRILFDDIQNHYLLPFDDIRVISIAKRNERAVLSEAVINPDQMNIYKSAPLSFGCRINGAPFYKQYYMENQNMFLNTNEDELRTALNRSMEAFENAYPGEYNPVGRDWQICII